MDLGDYYDSLKEKMKDFLEKIGQEKDETKEAFSILIDSINDGKKLTDEEKEKVGEQLKDVLKTLGLVGASILPGGFIYFLVAKVFKLNKYVLPSSFNEEKEKKKIKKYLHFRKNVSTFVKRFRICGFFIEIRIFINHKFFNLWGYNGID